jgi:hypothetical protein
VLYRTLESVSRRLKRPELNDGLEPLVAGLMPDFEQDFLAYFPDLLAHARDWLAERPLVEPPTAGPDVDDR